MTTTNRSFKSNLPAFELFTVEHTKQKMGVAFANSTEPGALSILVGPKGDPAQKRYLLCTTEAFDTAEPGSNVPVGELFETTDGPTDFEDRAGVAFRCADGSYNLLLTDESPSWDADDLLTFDVRQVRLNMVRWGAAAPLAPRHQQTRAPRQLEARL